ncbi:MAG TPA: hypothetical protein VJV78_49375 [Polyangiales bacterium]|nr:hypothetical protein [Polyangiales bacterium]
MRKNGVLERLTHAVAFVLASVANTLSAQGTHEQYACIVWQSAPIDESGSSVTYVWCPFESPEERNLPAVKLGFHAGRSDQRANFAALEPTNAWLAPKFGPALEKFRPEVRLTLWCRAQDADADAVVPITLDWASIVDPSLTGDVRCDSEDTPVLQVVSAETRVTW